MSDASAVATRKDIDEVIGIVKDFMQAADVRFNKLEDGQELLVKGQLKLEGNQLQLDAHQFSLESKFDTLKEEVIDLKRSHDRLARTIDKFVARIDGYETEMIVRDSQFEKLLAWARKVSEKTGIPLENL
jgi:septal ring factor EnvC (AmiA/AmiB activator)